MMNTLVTHSKIVPYNAEVPQSTYYRFVPEELHPFDRMKCILEQWFFYSYLKYTTTSSSSLASFLNSLEVHTAELPNELPGDFTNHRGMYALGMQLIEKIRKEDFHGMFFVDAFMIFTQAAFSEVDNRLYTSTMTVPFLAEWFSLIGKQPLTEHFPHQQLYDAAIYIPDMVTVQNYDPNVAKEDNEDFSLCIDLKAKPIAAFSLVENQTFANSGLFNLIHRCTFTVTPITLDDLVGCLASFSIDHDHYVMKLMDPYTPRSVADVCYDLVTGSSFTKDNAGVLVDHDTFIQLLQHLIREGQLLPCQDSELYGALIEKMGADPKIVNYFVQPDAVITGEEALAFRRSPYSALFADKFISSMEAIDDITEDQSAEEETGDGKEDMDGEDPIVGETQDPLSDNEPNSAEKPELDIDPDKMLLELAKPNENMADYIFREMVNRRITALLQNPPESARPNDLLMLKRWKSRWLYLTSIACLRDFLSRVSLRLSEV